MSVAEIANTAVTVYRGSAENQFGEAVDANIPLFTGVPAFIAETGKSVQDPASPTPRTIRQVTCQLPAVTGVLNTDRIMDESTGDVFIVISVTKPPTIIGAPVDLVLGLKRVTASGA